MLAVPCRHTQLAGANAKLFVGAGFKPAQGRGERRPYKKYLITLRTGSAVIACTCKVAKSVTGGPKLRYTLFNYEKREDSLSLKLLFADDSVTMHKVIQLTLESEDIELRIANDGWEALSAIGEEKPDVLIADIAMPIMNGFELCRQIKLSDETKDIPVVLLSGELEEYDEELGAMVGADAHLTKPFKSGEFIDTVRHLTVGSAAAGTGAAQPEFGLVAENDLEVEAGMSYEEEPASDSVADSEQDALLELTEAQGAEQDSAALPDTEFDEEFEVVSDDIEIDDSLDDEDDILSDGLDIEGVDMELEGLEEIAAQESEEDSITGAVEEAESSLANDQSMDDDLDSAFQGLSADVEADIETAVPAEEPEKVEEKPAESVIETDEEAAEPAEPIATESEKADEILDEVFKDSDIEPSDEQLEDVVEAVDKEDFVFDVPEAEAVEVDTSAAVVEGAAAEIVETDPEYQSAPVVEADTGRELPQLSQVDAGDALRDSVEKSVREFMETKAADIFREEISKSLDARLNSFMESQLEAIVKEEMSSAISKHIESAMPEIVAAAARITSEVTPKIAEELIKQTIEQIKKGDVS